MHNREKYPEIWASFEKAKKEEKALLEKRAPFVKRLQELNEEMESINSAKQEVNKQMMEETQPALVEVRARLSRLAKAMDGHALSDNA